MKRRRTAGLRSMLAVVVLVVFPGRLVPAAWAADQTSIAPGPADKCAVCGMPVASFPSWATAVVFKDGSRAFFDGPKDMFRYLFDLKKYNPSKQNADVAAVRVTDYYGVTFVDGKTAWYVEGSDVKGPMGDELVPFGKETDARAFLKDHKGKNVIPFASVTTRTVAPQGGHGGRGGHQGNEHHEQGQEP